MKINLIKKFGERFGERFGEKFGEGSQKSSQITTQIATQKTTQKGSQITTRKLTEKQAAILEYIREHPKAGRHEMAQNIEGITEDSIKYNLKRLQESGLLRHASSANGGHWEVMNE